MQVTKKQIERLSPCKNGYEWYLENCTEDVDLLALLLKINNHRSDWCNWLFTNLMNKEQCVKLSIFAAEKVLNNFEKEFSKDNRPRLAIEAAKNYLQDPTQENRSAAESAAWSAAESAAWSAAWSATWSARSAWSATRSTAWSVTESVRKQLQEDIIKEAVRILENE